MRGTYLDDEDVARLLKLSLPGIDEVIGLLEITRMAARGFDQIVVDTAPTGHTLRLLAAPALLGRVAGVLDTLQAHHRAVVAALRGSYQGDAADTLIGELERDGETLAAMLRDPAAQRGDVGHAAGADGPGGDVRRARGARRRGDSGAPADREPDHARPESRTVNGVTRAGDSRRARWPRSHRRFGDREMLALPNSRKSRAASPRSARRRWR